jgi:lysophospholipase L1-like esterase
MRWTQVGFLLVGLLLVVAGRTVPRSVADRPIVPKLILAAMATVLPLVAVELMLRPFAPGDPDAQGGARTTVFERDRELGWKLRPGARDLWGEVPVEINAKGLRGPELDYAKPAGVRRILYLGDSVTFGYRILGHEHTFPYRAETLLEQAAGGEIETINAGVGGWSPWQQHRFLAGEGSRYEPDLVVLCFVLNDVVEKFELLRFGGSGRGYQVAHAARSWTEALLAESAIGRFGSLLQARIRYGNDLPAGAAALETLGIQQLATEPDNERVQQAWEITLENVDKILAFSESRGIPVAIVLFPYAFQLDDAERLSAPQRRMREFAAARGVQIVDLLPAFAESSSDNLFLDQVHLTVEGHRLAAETIAARLAVP